MQGYCVLFWVQFENSTLQNSSYMATYLPSYKPSLVDEQDMLGTANEVWKNSLVTFSDGFQHIDTPV